MIETTTPNHDEHAPTSAARCAFCGYDIDEILQSTNPTCPECGSKLDDASIARDDEPPVAARSPLAMLGLLATATAIAAAFAALVYALSPIVINDVPLGVIIAITFNACFWVVAAPFAALAWADNLIRRYKLRNRLPLGSISPIYIAIVPFLIMAAAAAAVLWPAIKPWATAAPPALSGPAAAPSALQPPTNQQTNQQPSPAAPQQQTDPNALPTGR